MRYAGSLTIAVLSGALMAVPVRAEIVGGEPPLPSLDQRVSLDLQEADPRNVFQIFEQLLAPGKAGGQAEAGFAIRLTGTIDRTLTMSVRDVTARTALQVAAESLRCRLVWRAEHGRNVLYVTAEEAGAEPNEKQSEKSGSLDALLDLDVRDADFVSVVRTIVGASGHRKLAIDRALAGRPVSLTVTARPVREVLDLLCDQAGCRWEEGPDRLLEFRAR